MNKSFKSVIFITLTLTMLAGILCLPVTYALAAEPNEKIPQIRYVITIRGYYKKIIGNRVISYLLPQKNSSDFGGPFDLRSDVFRVAADIPLGQNKSVNEITGAESINEDHLAILIMEPDLQNRVSPSGSGARIGETTVAIDTKERLIATNTHGKAKKSHVIGHWLTLPTSEQSRFTPTLCQPREMPTPENQNNRDYRYAADDAAKTDPEQATDGTFGCREWAYQLYDAKRPYIDVTSYLRLPRIYGFIGWARAEDKKPVIGLEDKWMCLYDCPNGEQPGIIPDIVAWAKKNEWEPPQRPAKVPMFPDPIR